MFAENVNFIRYLRLSHAHLKDFTGAELNSQKTFTILDTFIRHIRQKHPTRQKEPELLFEPPFQLSSPAIKLLIPGDNDSGTEENYFLSEDSSEFDNNDCLSDEDLLWDDESFEPIDDFVGIESKVSPQEVKYVGNLYQFHEIPRKQINDLITETSELFESTLNSVKNEVCSCLGSLGDTKENLTEIEVVFQKFEKPFTHLRTEKQRFSQFMY